MSRAPGTAGPRRGWRRRVYGEGLRDRQLRSPALGSQHRPGLSGQLQPGRRQGPVFTWLWVSLLQPRVGTRGSLSLHHSYQFSPPSVNLIGVNHQVSRAMGIHGHRATFLRLAVSGLGTLYDNIYDFCLCSCLNSWTAIQISHDFNGIFGFKTSW